MVLRNEADGFVLSLAVAFGFCHLSDKSRRNSQGI